MLTLAEPKTVAEMRRQRLREELKGIISGQGFTGEVKPFFWRFRGQRHAPGLIVERGFPGPWG